jgi:hypothetical protein
MEKIGANFKNIFSSIDYLISRLTNLKADELSLKQGKGKRLRGKIIYFLALAIVFNLTVISAFSQQREQAVSASRPVEFSAFAQIRYTDYSSDGHDTFSLRRVRLAFSAAILPSLDFKVQIEQTKSVNLMEAYLDFHLSRWAFFRAGQFKIPFSYENLKGSSELDFINRSTVVESFCPGRDIGSQGRDIGASVRLHMSFFEASFGLFNGSGINRLDNDNDKDKAFRLVITLSKSLAVGGSWYEGKWPEAENSSRLRRRQGLEARWQPGSLAFAVEYIRAFDYDREGEGWVAQAVLSWRQGQIQPVLRYESLDRNLALAHDEEEVLTYGLNIHLAPRTKIQLNQEIHRPEGGKKKNIFLIQCQIGF